MPLNAQPVQLDDVFANDPPESTSFSTSRFRDKHEKYYRTRQSSCVTARGVPPAPPPAFLDLDRGGEGPRPWPWPWPGGPQTLTWTLTKGGPQTLTWWGPPRPWPGGSPDLDLDLDLGGPQTLTRTLTWRGPWTLTKGVPGPWPRPWPRGSPQTLTWGGAPRPWPGLWPGGAPDLDLDEPAGCPWAWLWHAWRGWHTSLGGGPCGQTEMLKTLPSRHTPYAGGNKCIHPFYLMKRLRDLKIKIKNYLFRQPILGFLILFLVFQENI